MRNCFLMPVAVAIVVLVSQTTCAADTLDQIHERGSLRWGGDASGGGPYIYEGPENKLVGFEYELVD